MRSIKKARLMIEADPLSKGSLTMSSLVTALESESHFNLNRLYELDLVQFEMALNVIKDWRVDRYYMGKAKILDIATQATKLKSQSTQHQQ